MNIKNKFQKKKQIKIIYIWNRTLIILPIMLGFTIMIHCGNTYIPIFITEKLIGYKLGEFAKTCKLKFRLDNQKKYIKNKKKINEKKK